MGGKRGKKKYKSDLTPSPKEMGGGGGGRAPPTWVRFCALTISEKKNLCVQQNHERIAETLVKSVKLHYMHTLTLL